MTYISSTYLKEVNDYVFGLFYDSKKEYYITIKKINKIKESFTLQEEGKKVTIIDNGYYILEYIPLKEKYICRIHINEKKKVIERFFIASKDNKVENHIPTYEDLKLSLVCLDDIIKIYHLDLINDLRKNNKMTLDDYQSAVETINNLKKQIELKNNFIFNLDYEQFLKELEMFI